MAINNCFYIKNTGDEPVTIANRQWTDQSWGFDYSINDTEHWIVDTVKDDIVLNPGDKVYFKGTKTNAAWSPTGGGLGGNWFRLPYSNPDISLELGGSLASLLHDGDGDNEELVHPSTNPEGYYTFGGIFSSMYSSVIKLNIDNLKLPSKLAPTMYYESFANQKGLTSIPKNFLPATSFPKECYRLMFWNAGIIKAPEDLILNKHLSDQCYQSMFAGCNNLNEITVYFSNWDDEEEYHATKSWVSGVAPTGTFHCPSKLPLIYDESHIPVGWNVEYTDKVPEHRTITLNGSLKAPFNKWANLKPGG